MNRENNFEEIQPVQSSTIPLPVAGKDMNSILKSLETGVENIFTGEKYAQYLQNMEYMSSLGQSCSKDHILFCFFYCETVQYFCLDFIHCVPPSLTSAFNRNR